jgi:hypothetical protein
MIGSPGRRNPSTTSGDGPRFQTVAPKSRKSRLPRCWWLIEIPHAGSAIRSGRMLGSGFVMIGNDADGAATDACARPARPERPAPSQNGRHVNRFVVLTVTSTLTVASVGAIPSRLW